MPCPEHSSVQVPIAVPSLVTPEFSTVMHSLSQSVIFNWGQIGRGREEEHLKAN